MLSTCLSESKFVRRPVTELNWESICLRSLKSGLWWSQANLFRGPDEASGSKKNYWGPQPLLPFQLRRPAHVCAHGDVSMEALHCRWEVRTPAVAWTPSSPAPEWGTGCWLQGETCTVNLKVWGEILYNLLSNGNHFYIKIYSSTLWSRMQIFCSFLR